MDIKETLKRYHISPLRYEDGTELSEKDYISLFEFMTKYFYAKNTLSENKKSYSIPENLINQVERLQKFALIPASFDDVMDILMEQTGGQVI